MTAALVLTGSPASAQPIELEHYSFSGEDMVEGFCGDLTMQGVFKGSGIFMVSGHGDGLYYFLDNFKLHESLTNIANGRTMTIETRFHNKDVTIDEHGDGTFTIHVQSTGVRQTRGDDGRLYGLNAAAISYDLLVSDGGTPDDPFDDEVIAEPVITREVGRNDEAGVEFCDTVHELIG